MGKQGGAQGGGGAIALRFAVYDFRSGGAPAREARRVVGVRLEARRSGGSGGGASGVDAGG